MEKKQTICNIATQKEDVIAGINQAVWNYAEYGYQEEKSAAKIVETLRKEGFEVEEGIAEFRQHLWEGLEVENRSLVFWLSMMHFQN